MLSCFWILRVSDMRILAAGRTGSSFLFCVTLLVSAVPPGTAWDADLELLDLVEEIPQTFYQFLKLDQVGAND